MNLVTPCSGRFHPALMALVALASMSVLGPFSPSPVRASGGHSASGAETITLPPGKTWSPGHRLVMEDTGGPMVATEPLAGKEDRTLSPYFFIPGGDSSTDRLPLKSTSADIAIAGVIADVTVTQVYTNEGEHPIEAIYVFPGSTRAAVYGMQMTIGERTIKAEIQERKAAREAYETARAEGKSASLLEQQRPNVFQMNVANIMPGDEIRVELRYTELLVPTDGIYELVYPTVVGPRYSNTPAEGAPDTERWVANPYLGEGQAPTYTFDLTATLDAGMPIQEMAVPTHQVHIQYESASRAALSLDGSEASGGNRDFILRYRLAGSRVQSGLLLYQGEKENFFLLMNQPPARVESDMIVPREYVFVVDVSGSMSGYPLNISKTLLKNLIGNLNPEERFNVILFAGTSAMMASRSLEATPANIQKAIRVIDEQRGGGGTELLPALKRAFGLPRFDGYARTIIVVTDGYVSVEPKAFDLIRKRLGDANLFAFGIGSSVNRHLIEGMARVGQGEPFVLTDPGVAPAKAEKFREYIQSPVLTDVEVEFVKFDTYDVEPISIPDVFAQRPVVVFGKWRGKPRGTVTVRGLAGGEPYEQTFDVAEFPPADSNSALRYLWARHRIALLGDYQLLAPSDERVKEITNLGLQYNLLTAYTSFVAIDSEVRAQPGSAKTVVQPLPLPDGVSNSALGVSGRTMGYGSGGAAVRRKTKGMALSGVRRSVQAPVPEASVAAEGGPAPVGSLDAVGTVPGELEESKARSEAQATSQSVGPQTSSDKKAETDDTGTSVVVRVDQVHVSGGLDEASVRKFLEAHVAMLRACYQNVLSNDPESHGRLVLEISVDRTGKVVSVSVRRKDQTLDNDMLIACWTSRVQRWQFGAAGSESTIEVTWILSP